MSTGSPNAVGDVIKKAAFIFDTLGKEEGLQGPHASVSETLVAGPVTVTSVLQKDSGLHVRPFVIEIFLPTYEEGGPGLRAEPLPGAAVADRGKGAVSILSYKSLFQPLRAAGAGKKTAFPASRSSPIDVERKQPGRCCKCRGSCKKATAG